MRQARAWLRSWSSACVASRQNRVSGLKFLPRGYATDMAADRGRSVASCDSHVEPEYHVRRRRASVEQTMGERTRVELEAVVFRRLVAHLRQRTDVQNIDMMIRAGLCRDCMSEWYCDAGAAR